MKVNHYYFTMLEPLLGQKTFQRTFRIPSFKSIESVCHKSRRTILKAFQPHLRYFKTFFSQVRNLRNVLEQSACSIYLAVLLSVRESRLWLRGGLQNYSPASHCYAEK